MDWAQTSAVFRDFLMATGYSADTTRSYLSALRIYKAWAESEALDIEAADRTVIARFIAHQRTSLTRTGRLPSNFTVRNQLFGVRCFYQFHLFRNGLIDDLEEDVGPLNPTFGAKVKKPKTMPKQPVTLPDQRRLVFGAAARSPRDEALYMTLIDSGMRIGEAARMLIENITWETGMVLLRGKGDKERIAWLGTETLALIREVAGERIDGPLWLTQQGKPMSRDRIRQNFDRLATRVRVKAHPHRLRASFANTFLKEGGDLGALQVAMGHADISTTAQYAKATSGERALDHVKQLNLAHRLGEE